MEKTSQETKPNIELEKIKDRVTLINSKNPNFEGLVIGVEITVSDFQGLNLDHHGPNDTSETP
jgi:hypothetical protein